MNDYSNECLFKDTYTIIEMMDDKLRSKISTKFIEFLASNKDNTFEGTINPSIPLKQQNLHYELKLMLSLIYIYYMCDEETKEKIKKQDEENIRTFYSTDIFDKRNTNKSNNTNEVKSSTEIFNKKKNTEETSLIEYKENFFKKIINFIKNIFNKNA